MNTSTTTSTTVVTTIWKDGVPSVIFIVPLEPARTGSISYRTVADAGMQSAMNDAGSRKE